MAVLSLMHSIFPRKEFLEKCRKMYGFLYEKCRNLLCSWSGRKGRGSKKMKILLSYINKKDSHTSTVMGVFLS